MRFPTSLTSRVDPLEQRHGANENTNVLTIRYSFYPPLDTLFNHRVSLFTTTAIELLAKRIWYRTLAWIKEVFFRGARPGTPTTTPSSAARLPQEVVDMVVAYLAYDTGSLLACCHTSRSWYIAAMSHRRLTLDVHTDSNWFMDKKRWWPRPLRMVYKFGLLPFVTKLLINEGGRYGEVFSSRKSHYWTRREFSALTNVRELSIHGLDIPSFMPRIQKYLDSSCRQSDPSPWANRKGPIDRSCASSGCFSAWRTSSSMPIGILGR